MKTILVVDDTPTNIDIVKEVLSKSYFIQAALNGKMALKILEKYKPDLILSDIMMPKMDGYELCKRIKENPKTSHIPIIFLTAKSEMKDEAKGFSLGAVDYIVKPISPIILEKRIKIYLELKLSKDLLKQQNELLEDKVKERTYQLAELQDVVMVAIGALAETRDPETGNHVRRTQYYIKILADELSKHSKYKKFLTNENITLISKSAPLHDIGKVGIPDSILLKPSKLTEEEFNKMKEHPIIGRDAILSAERHISKSHNFLFFAKEIIYYHHEKWNGTGYPEGIKGENIPLSARMMSLVDVYDALVNKRSYKPAFSHDTAKENIIKGRGSHFDPDIVDAFLEISDEFEKIAVKYRD